MPKTAAKTKLKPSTTPDMTRERLLKVALEQFALRGVQAVSLREITAAAGASNQSAIHYHFTNKNGLLKAILAHINELLAPLQAEALSELEALAKDKPPVRDIIALAFAPFMQLFAGSREGRMAVRLFSRLTWESGKAGQGLLVKSVRPYFLKIEPHLIKALPNKPQDKLRLHFYLAVNNLIHGLTDMTLLGEEPIFGVQDLYENRPADLQQYFLDYISAGVASN